jgi:hypothetical protein
MSIVEGAAAVIGKMMTFEECGGVRNKSLV